jgi:hypothetical protein
MLSTAVSYLQMTVKRDAVTERKTVCTNFCCYTLKNNVFRTHYNSSPPPPPLTEGKM